MTCVTHCVSGATPDMPTCTAAVTFEASTWLSVHLEHAVTAIAYGFIITLVVVALVILATVVGIVYCVVKSSRQSRAGYPGAVGGPYGGGAGGVYGSNYPQQFSMGPVHHAVSPPPIGQGQPFPQQPGMQPLTTPTPGQGNPPQYAASPFKASTPYAAAAASPAHSPPSAYGFGANFASPTNSPQDHYVPPKF